MEPKGGSSGLKATASRANDLLHAVNGVASRPAWLHGHALVSRSAPQYSAATCSWNYIDERRCFVLGWVHATTQSNSPLGAPVRDHLVHGPACPKPDESLWDTDLERSCLAAVSAVKYRPSLFLRVFIDNYQWKGETMSEFIMVQDRNAQEITEHVRARYAAAAQGVRTRAQTGCCDAACCGDPVTGNLYDATQTDSLPEDAVVASLGCGNPTALIDLHEGETVLDLGSGGGIDVLLSARRVGPTGFAFGLDMTDEMLALAMANKEKAGARNVAFLKGHIEAIPLPANSVDVVISNCVINLSADKGQVLRDAFRVLKPGGRFAVSDVVAEGAVPAALRSNMEAWVGCLAGALEMDSYRDLLTSAGFEEVEMEITRRYTVAEAGLDPSTLPAGWQDADGKLASAFVRATKPLGMGTGATAPALSSSAESCCGTSCCS